jgi:predicted SprT family Zn-dependent metalloprotease
MDLDHATEIAFKLIRANGLIDWDFKLNKNKRRLGVCKEYIKRIELSEHYVLRNEYEHVTDTILHEIAHALVGAEHGHDAVWKDMCLRLGCTPKACENAVEMPVGDWRAQCPGCKQLFHRHKKPARLRGMYCVPCGPEQGRLAFSNARLNYQKRIEKEQQRESNVQLMLKFF